MQFEGRQRIDIMPRGICKLCLDEDDLLESHFMPRALYPERGGMEYRTRNRSGLDETQLKQYLLCGDCEERFNKNGESEVLRRIATKSRKRFPLHEKLSLAFPREVQKGWARFAGCDLGLDMAKFAYFTLSLVWRGAVAQWAMPGGEQTTLFSIGSFEEPFRRFLLGNAPFPADTSVIVFVHSDAAGRDALSIPPGTSGFEFLSFGFLARGVYFRACMGKNVPQEFQDFSCTSPRDCIFYGNGEQDVSQAIRPLARMP